MILPHRDRERETDTERDVEREWEREREGQTETERGRERERREKQRERERDMERLTYEVVGDGPHAVVAPHGEADEEVAGDADDEHDEVDADEQPLGRRRLHVVDDHVHVLRVRHAIVVRAQRRVRRVRDVITA